MHPYTVRADGPSSASPSRSSRARRLAATACGLLALVVAAGCASFYAIDSDVSSYGTWPADRAAGTYVFDRLPSQSAHAARQARLEAAAAGALAQAGFRPAAEGAPADVTVQVGARIDVTEIVPWADPLWWHGPYFGPSYIVRGPGPVPRPWWGPGPWVGPGPGPFWGPFGYERDQRYSRQVAVLIRDRATGLPLYEAHAETSGSTSGGDRLMSAMFAGALAEFPHAEARPHTVRTMLPPLPGDPAQAPAPAAPAASVPVRP